jgi:hypothetical protein
MNVQLYDPRSSSSSTTFNNDLSKVNAQLSSQLSSPISIQPNTETATTETDQLINSSTLEKQREKRNFYLFSSDQRIKETSVKRYAETLSALSQLKSSDDFLKLINNNSQYYKQADNQLGAALSSILADGKIVHNGQVVNLTNLESLLKNDKDHTLSALIAKKANDLVSSNTLQQKLLSAEENYDTEGIKVGAAAAGTAVLWKAKQMGTQAVIQTTGQEALKDVSFGGIRAMGAGLKSMGARLKSMGAGVGKFLVNIGGQKLFGQGLAKIAQTGLMRGVLPLAALAVGLPLSAAVPMVAGAGFLGFVAWQVGFMVVDCVLKKATGKDSTEYVKEAFSPVTDWVGDRASEVGDAAGYHFSKLI